MKRFKCEKCGKEYKACVQACPDCFDYSVNTMGPLFNAGLATADKIFAESPCPLDVEIEYMRKKMMAAWDYWIDNGARIRPGCDCPMCQMAEAAGLDMEQAYKEYYGLEDND